MICMVEFSQDMFPVQTLRTGTSTIHFIMFDNSAMGPSRFNAVFFKENKAELSLGPSLDEKKQGDKRRPSR